MRRIISIIFILLVIVVANGNAQSQSVKNLKEKQKKTLEKLQMTGKMLDDNKKNTTSTLSRLNMLNEKITTRQTLISQINEEITLVDADILKLRNEIGLQQTELQSIKQEYAQLMYHTYLRRNSHDKLMFILSAKTFSQSYRRLRYLQEFSDYRKEQAKHVENVTTELNAKLSELERAKTEKQTVLVQREVENKQLVSEKDKQRFLISDLKKKEKDLVKQQNIQQRQINNLNDKIAKLIAEEERKAEERQQKEAEKKRAAEEKKRLAEEKKQNNKPKPATTSKTTNNSVATVSTPKPTPVVPEKKVGYVMTKEEQLIAGNFEKNKGRLPWPVSKGIIVGRFGIQQHPVLTHVTTNNKGIYIQTEKNEDARAVFEGEVTQRFSIPGNNNAVIIRHGNYRTVYSNLTDIYVKEGDKVSAKQRIGKIYTDSEDGKTALYFMVWKEKELQNPELFLAK
jgi:septal ring factor EnvC (AmiA/AmiB activator)